MYTKKQMFALERDYNVACMEYYRAHNAEFMTKSVISYGILPILVFDATALGMASALVTPYRIKHNKNESYIDVFGEMMAKYSVSLKMLGKLNDNEWATDKRVKMQKLGRQLHAARTDIARRDAQHIK